MRTVSLFYEPSENIWEHEDGRILYDISNLLSHTEIAELKRWGGTKYIRCDEDDVIYEINVPIPDDSEGITFTYDKDANLLYDECGFIMFNIFAYISPQDLLLFKDKKKNMQVYGKDGRIVNLIYDQWEVE